MLCTQDGEIAFSYLIYIPCSHLENNERVGHEARFNQIYKIKVFRGEMWYFNFMRNFSINQKYFALSPSLTWISKNICFINDHHKDNRMPLIWKTFFFSLQNVINLMLMPCVPSSLSRAIIVSQNYVCFCRCRAENEMCDKCDNMAQSATSKNSFNMN